MSSENKLFSLDRVQTAVKLLRAWQVVLVVAGIYLLAVLASNHWDPMAFVMVGGKFDPQAANTSYGYDGQFAYQIAKDPAGASPYLDAPAYRYQRIFYPILAYALSLGQAQFLPWILLLINLAALVVGTWFTELILVRSGNSPWYALCYGLFIGMILSTRLDLTEPLAYCLVQGGILALQARKPWLSLIPLALASLTRETTLVFVAAFALDLLFAGRWKRAFAWGALATLPFLLWHLFLGAWLGSWGLASGGAFATSFEIIPFGGWLRIAWISLPSFLLMSLLILPMSLIPAAACLFIAARSVLKGKRRAWTWALLLSSAFFLFLPMSNISDPIGLARTTDLLVIAVLWYASQERNSKMLNYSLLWIATLVFLPADSFLPKG